MERMQTYKTMYVRGVSTSLSDFTSKTYYVREIS